MKEKPVNTVLSMLCVAIFVLQITTQKTLGEARSNEIGEKMIFAHLMHQMSVGAESAPNESPLSYSPSMENGTMATFHIDYLKNYRKPIPAARQDIELAKKAGVDAFSILLSPSHLPNSQFASIINAYFKVASDRNDFYICPDIWWTGEAGDQAAEKLANALGYIAESYDNAWPRKDGKRIVFWNTASKSKSVFDKVFSKIGGLESVFLVLYEPKELKESAPVAYGIANAFTAWPHSCYATAIRRVEGNVAAAQAAAKPFWYPVMGAFAQSRANGSPPPVANVREKLGMVNFVVDWRRAMASDAKVVCLQTWNDLSEDSAIGPESNHGYAFYELARYFSELFHTGKEPPIEREEILLFHHPQVTKSLSLPLGRKSMTGFSWEMVTPPTDYIGVVSMLKSPATVGVMLGENIIASYTCPSGMSVWLIYHPVGGTAPDAYPQETPELKISTVSEPFSDAEVYIDVYRDGERANLFRSHRPIVDHAGRGELTTVGDVFLIE